MTTNIANSTLWKLAILSRETGEMEAEEEDFEEEEEEEGRESAAVRAAEAMAAKWELDVGLLEGPEGD